MIVITKYISSTLTHLRINIMDDNYTYMSMTAI
jgi:hypothetical protein